jgi:hypothetical protein
MKGEEDDSICDTLDVPSYRSRETRDGTPGSKTRWSDASRLRNLVQQFGILEMSDPSRFQDVIHNPSSKATVHSATKRFTDQVLDRSGGLAQHEQDRDDNQGSHQLPALG